ncbi:MAG: hypothetical protein L3J66_07210 [Bacteroidales bacterium]|nr:hypothetical protein [Bacteroidales bacterium]
MNKLVFLFALLFLFSCHAQKEVAKQQNKKAEVACKPMLLLTEEVNATASDFFDLDSLAVTNNCLEAFVTYSGGCGGAAFELYYTNKVMHSMPPQTTLFLHFKDDDPCRSIVQDTLYFDLSVFTELASSGGIWLRLKDSDKRVLLKDSN